MDRQRSRVAAMAAPLQHDGTRPFSRIWARGYAGKFVAIERAVHDAAGGVATDRECEGEIVEPDFDAVVPRQPIAQSQHDIIVVTSTFDARCGLAGEAGRLEFG